MSEALGSGSLHCAGIRPSTGIGVGLIIDGEAREFVESQRVGRLATADERGRPHVVPICFALDGDTLYTPIDEKPKAGDYTRLRRLRSIAVNPHVQVLLDLYDDADWSRLRYVQLRGTTRVIDGGDEHTRAIALLRARHGQYAAMNLDARPVIAVDVERVVQWSAAHGGASRKALGSDITEGLP